MKLTTSTLTILFLTSTFIGFGKNAEAGPGFSKPHHDGKSACYRWSAFPNERLYLSIKHHSQLTWKEHKHHQLHQGDEVTYSVHGKHIGACGGNSVAATTGTVVTSSESKHVNEEGSNKSAYLSLNTGSVRGRHDSRKRRDYCRPVSISCTSGEHKSDPDKWYCFSRNEFNEFHGISTLEKVDADQDDRCKINEEENQVDAESMEGTGSGLESPYLESDPLF